MIKDHINKGILTPWKAYTFPVSIIWDVKMEEITFVALDKNNFINVDVKTGYEIWFDVCQCDNVEVVARNYSFNNKTVKKIFIKWEEDPL